jgi:hypothetical protein
VIKTPFGDYYTKQSPYDVAGKVCPKSFFQIINLKA